MMDTVDTIPDRIMQMSKDALVEALFEKLDHGYFHGTTREQIREVADDFYKGSIAPSWEPNAVEEAKAQAMRLILNDLEKMINPTLVRNFLGRLPNQLDR